MCDKGTGAKLYHTRIYSATALTLSQIRAGTSANGTQVAQTLMWWTGYGDLTRARDVKNSNQNQCFEYDTTGRLTEAYTTDNTGGCNGSAAAGNGRYHYTYQYEDNGNIDQVTDHLTSTTHQYTYGAGTAGPHAVTTMGSTTYLYDANGNQTNRGSDVLTWDASNRLTKYDPPGAGSTQFIYDADGTRIVRLDPDGTATTTISNVYEHVQGGTPIERVTYRFNGQTVAVRTIQGTSNTLDWIIVDYLGSTTVTRDATTGATVRQWYNPYGAQRANTGGSLPTEETYTGQTNDASTGLMHYNARYYDPTLRRFISADTIIPNPSDPADLNRYTYVHNNPTNNTDPTGHCRTASGYELYDGPCASGEWTVADDALLADVAGLAEILRNAGWEESYSDEFGVPLFNPTSTATNEQFRINNAYLKMIDELGLSQAVSDRLHGNYQPRVIGPSFTLAGLVRFSDNAAFWVSAVSGVIAAGCIAASAGTCAPLATSVFVASLKASTVTGLFSAATYCAEGGLSEPRCQAFALHATGGVLGRFADEGYRVIVGAVNTLGSAAVGLECSRIGRGDGCVSSGPVARAVPTSSGFVVAL